MRTLDSKQIESAGQLHEATRQFRGKVLNTFSFIDHFISEILASHFCISDRRALAISDIFSKRNIESNIRLLKKVIKEEFGSYLSQNPDFFKNIDELRELRNDLAHSRLDLSDGGLAKADLGIGFVSYKDGCETVRFITFEESHNFEEKIYKVYDQLREIGGLFGLDYQI